MQFGDHGNDGSFSEFRERVLSNELTYEKGTVTYTDPDWGTLRYSQDTADPSQVRVVNGKSVDYTPKWLYDSPYLKSRWDSGVVRVTYDGESIHYDFSRD